MTTANLLRNTDPAEPPSDDADFLRRIHDRLVYLAWRRFGLKRETSEDLVQAAVTTFLEVRPRYPRREEHPAILTGIFRNKCREYIETTLREKRILDAFARRSAGAAVPHCRDADHDAEQSAYEEVVRREEAEIILDSLAALRPEAREMFELIATKGVTRRDLIEQYGLNKNTLDSRLHTYRRELRNLLARRGIHC